MKLKPEKNSGLNGTRTYDLCDTAAVLYQLSFKPTGSRSGCEFVIYLYMVKDTSWYALFMCDTLFSCFVILDSIISKKEYLEYQKDSYRKLLGMEMPGYRVTIEEDTFNEMDRNDTGVIDWWEFMIPMCVRKLTERKKVIVWVYYDDKKSLEWGEGGLADWKNADLTLWTTSPFDGKLWLVQVQLDCPLW